MYDTFISVINKGMFVWYIYFAQGKRIQVIKLYYAQDFLEVIIKRFYQKKKICARYINIKICKIPILHLRSM